MDGVPAEAGEDEAEKEEEGLRDSVTDVEEDEGEDEGRGVSTAAEVSISKIGL